MIIRFGGDDLKIYTPSSVFRYTFISLSRYVFARLNQNIHKKTYEHTIIIMIMKGF